jgi:hypothetical protein
MGSVLVKCLQKNAFVVEWATMPGGINISEFGTLPYSFRPLHPLGALTTENGHPENQAIRTQLPKIHRQ